MLGQRDHGSHLLAAGELHGTGIVLAGPLDAASLGFVAPAIEGDHELMGGAAIVRLVQGQAATDHGLDQPEIGHQFHVLFVRGNGRGPGNGRPVKSGDVFSSQEGQGLMGIPGEPVPEARFRRLQRAQGIITAPQIESLRAPPQFLRTAKGRVLDLVGGQRHVGIGVLGEASCGRDQKTAMLGYIGQQALHGLQAERHGRADQLHVVVGGVDGAIFRQGIGDGVGRGPLYDRAPGRRNRDAYQHNPEAAGRKVYACTSIHAAMDAAGSGNSKFPEFRNVGGYLARMLRSCRSQIGMATPEVIRP